MKKLLSLLLAVCLLAGILPLGAAAAGVTYETNGGKIWFSVEEDGLQIVRASGLKGDVAVPETVEGLPVVSLYYEVDMSGMSEGSPAFTGNTEMTSITFPKTFASILGGGDDGADIGPFGGCGALKKIEFLGDAPEQLGPGVLNGAQGLSAVVLPKKLKELDARFCTSASLKSLELDRDNPYLTIDSQNIVYDKAAAKVVCASVGREERRSATLPGTVTEIAEFAFSGNTKLTEVKGLSQVGTIGPWAFRDCESLKEAVLSEDLTVLRDETFQNCRSLVSVRFPKKLEAIMNGVFDGCSSLAEAALPDSLYRIGKRAFQGTALKTVEVPGGVDKVQDNCFAQCPQLTEATLREGVKTIEWSAFRDCASLKSVSLPDSMQSIWHSPGISHTEVFEGAAAELTIHGFRGSAADLYAEEAGIRFEARQRPGLTDMEKHWAKDDVDWAYQMGYVRGVSDGVFAPEAPLDRAMFVTILYRMEREPEWEEGPDGPFVDGEDGYFRPGMLWAWKNGIVKGIDSTHFGPSVKITREQLAAFLYRYADFKKLDTAGRAELAKFPDEGEAAGYAKEALSWAVRNGILNSRTNGRLDPKGNAARAEAAAMLHRFALWAE